MPARMGSAGAAKNLLPAADRLRRELREQRRNLDGFRAVLAGVEPGAAVVPALQVGIEAVRAHLRSLAEEAARYGVRAG